MSTDYFSAHASREEAEAAAKAVARKKSRKYWAIGVVAALAIPGAAYAFYQEIFGEGSVSAEAATAQTLTVNQSGITPEPLFPGGQVDVKFRVTNPNKFPVTVQKVRATAFSSSNCTTGAEQAWFSGFATGLNQDVTLATPVTVAPNGNSVVTIPNGLKLSNDATKGCQYTIGIKVTAAQTGGGNAPATPATTPANAAP